MSKDKVLIISGSEPVLAGGRPLAARGDGPTAHISERSVNEVQENMQQFLKNLGQIISLDDDVGAHYQIDVVEVNAQITGKGQVGFLGTGVNVGASAGVKIVLQRKAE